MNHFSKAQSGYHPQQAIMEKCFHPSGTFVEFKKEEIEQSIPDRFEQQVAKYPDRLAVKTRSHVLTYEALNKFANRTASGILQERGEGQESIALLLENDAPMIAAIIGVLKAGKMCVVLDPSFPRARIAYMLEDSQSGLLVTDRKNLSLARELAHGERPLMNIDELDGGLSLENPGLSLSPDNLTYIVYTSGSTGHPKGVMQNHRNGLHEAMLYSNGLHICPDDRLAFLYSCSASQGMKITFGALLNGAALCPYNFQQEGVRHLADWLLQGITIYFSIPIVFRQFVSTFTGKEEFPQLRLIQLGSDSVTPREVEDYKKHFSTNAIFVVRLGSTETGTLRRYFFDRETPLAAERVPVGYAIEDTEVSLLDDEGKNVGFNCVGEIAVKSRYISPGYWRRPDLTQAKFLPDPNGGGERIYLTGDLGSMLPDGCLVHLGRKDFQTTIRGYRIEVEEVERALLDLPAIKEAAVITREPRPGDKSLVAYLISAKQPAPASNELRGVLAEKLPDYMIPSTFVFMGALPLTPNGKVDRRALPDQGRSRPELDTPFVAPRTPVEKELTQIWTDILSLDRVGIHDNFFELGGHSLAAIQVISRVIERFDVEVSVTSLFEGPTVEGMAEVIARCQNQPAKDGD